MRVCLRKLVVVVESIFLVLPDLEFLLGISDPRENKNDGKGLDLENSSISVKTENLVQNYVLAREDVYRKIFEAILSG